MEEYTLIGVLTLATTTYRSRLWRGSKLPLCTGAALESFERISHNAKPPTPLACIRAIHAKTLLHPQAQHPQEREYPSVNN